MVTPPARTVIAIGTPARVGESIVGVCEKDRGPAFGVRLYVATPLINTPITMTDLPFKVKTSQKKTRQAQREAREAREAQKRQLEATTKDFTKMVGPVPETASLASVSHSGGSIIPKALVFYCEYQLAAQGSKGGSWVERVKKLTVEDGEHDENIGLDITELRSKLTSFVDIKVPDGGLLVTIKPTDSTPPELVDAYFYAVMPQTMNGKDGPVYSALRIRKRKISNSGIGLIGVIGILHARCIAS